ncbi:hypothetical protein C8J25_101388 [Sphingomonas faeni]|uniref:AAA domain-containing protein n=2 Tax=Sphingomonas faeni TaxID=185950 RepID=A0A2T5UBM3_9SPHN|nr:hypothetical protein C8J25_101388 [Sphingomonas faeni]
MKGITLRHLAFTGPDVETANLDFVNGLNVLYGASNTGKSFALKALNFMFGGSVPLPGIEQRVDYDALWMGLVLPDGKHVTVYRAASGGAFKIFDGLLTSTPSGEEGQLLQAQHDAKRPDNLSQYLLTKIGMSGKVVAKNMNGEKESLSFRNLAPYMFVSEETIISERSPVLFSGQVIRETAEKNIFKVLLTGRDDSAVVTTQDPKLRKASQTAQIALIDEWIASLKDQLGEDAPAREAVQKQLSALEDALNSHHDTFKSRLDIIDALVSERRRTADMVEATSARLLELELTLSRFAKLAAIYTSDIQRLEALEEGGYLLMAIAGRSCPVCGAPADAQIHKHGAEEIARSHRAAAAEVRKISLERRDLELTQQSLSAEAEGLRRRLANAETELVKIERQLTDARPQEALARQAYEALSLRKSEVDAQLSVYDECARLELKRSQLDVPLSRKKGEKLAVGIDGPTAFEFSKTVQSVLSAWNFPDAANVRFDPLRQDIEVGGKERAANGKGVRAILHAAFKVATLIYCREKNLPHPGILILDTPLLTYREPLVQVKYGDLEPDEIAIQATGLAEKFYEHLASISHLGQFFILENADPPLSVRVGQNVEIFTGMANVGRSGFFPPRDLPVILSLAA